jgi:subtilisin family serine protease
MAEGTKIPSICWSFPDEPGRPLFTGRSIIAVTADRAPGYIDTFMTQLVQLIPPDAFAGESDTLPEIGAAVIAYPADEIQRLIESNPDRLSGGVVDRERYLYPPRVMVLPPPNPLIPPLAAIGVRDGHKGRVPILVLDSGIDDTHPDFVNRGVIAVDFTGSGTTMDTEGHGTHCAGIACGPAVPYDGSDRYGVACESTVAVGKVTTDFKTSDGEILQGIRWARKHGIVVINISLGGNVRVNEAFSTPFEIVARRALNDGILIVAAAGNDYPEVEWPVQHPANCPSVMAVAGLDGNYQQWNESCASVNAGQYVDIAAPGYRIRSSYLNHSYATESGTSAACAFVSGVAALWADTPSAPRGQRLWCALTGSAQPVQNAGIAEVGAGIVQAPPL